MLLCTSFVFISIIEFFVVSLFINCSKDKDNDDSKKSVRETNDVLVKGRGEEVKIDLEMKVKHYLIVKLVVVLVMCRNVKNCRRRRSLSPPVLMQRERPA